MFEELLATCNGVKFVFREQAEVASDLRIHVRLLFVKRGTIPSSVSRMSRLVQFCRDPHHTTKSAGPKLRAFEAERGVTAWIIASAALELTSSTSDTDHTRS
jgi:hypothetical protein